MAVALASSSVVVAFPFVVVAFLFDKDPVKRSTQLIFLKLSTTVRHTNMYDTTFMFCQFVLDVVVDLKIIHK